MTQAVLDSRLLSELGEHLIKHGKNFEFKASGSSMRPTILDGDIVRVGGVHPHQIRIGNILLCRLGRRLVVHRVVSLERTEHSFRLTLQGDSSPSTDSPVDVSHVLGRVLALQRGDLLIEVGERHRHVTQRVRVVARKLKHRLRSALPTSQR